MSLKGWWFFWVFVSTSYVSAISYLCVLGGMLIRIDVGIDTFPRAVVYFSLDGGVYFACGVACLCCCGHWVPFHGCHAGCTVLVRVNTE